MDAKFGDPQTPQPALLDLTDAQFDKPASFRNATFLNRFPDFTGAILHDKSLFEAEGDYWPSKTDHRPVDARDSCAFLRHHLGKQGLPEAEHFFFRREMGFAQRISLGSWVLLGAFGLVSSYGHAVWRLVLFQVLLWLAGFVIFQGCGRADQFCMIDPPQNRLLPSGDAAGLSFSNLFRFFGFQVVYFREFLGSDDLADGYKVFASLQTVLSFILLFFLGLGLRQRFRLR